MVKELRYYSDGPGIDGGVTRDFFRGSPTEPCALRSTQPLKVSTRDFSWGKGGRCVWLTTYHSCSAETSKYPGTVTTRNPLGHLGLSRDTVFFNPSLQRRHNKAANSDTRYS